MDHDTDVDPAPGTPNPGEAQALLATLLTRQISTGQIRGPSTAERQGSILAASPVRVSTVSTASNDPDSNISSR